ncbi:MAG: general secretion pathway protein K [Alteromonadaceae bacterium]|jgi:general secretion pathway protein K
MDMIIKNNTQSSHIEHVSIVRENISLQHRIKQHRIKQHGIALIQILIIVAILSTVALYVSKSAKQQVQMAQWAVDRTQANVNLHSAQVDVLFEILTNTWQQNTIASNWHEQQQIQTENLSQRQKQKNNTFSNIKDNAANRSKNAKLELDSNTQLNSLPWNLYGQAFTLTQGVHVKIQDQAGLINLHYPAENTIVQILMYAGLTNTEALSAEAILLDWQDGDNIARDYGDESTNNIRNNLLADKREWSLHKNISGVLLNAISNNFTLYGSGYLNLMTSPKSLIASLSNDNIAEQIINQQSEMVLNERQVAELMDLSPAIEMYFFPSRTLEITVFARYGEAKTSRKVMVKFTPYTDGVRVPYNIMQTSNG